MHRFFTLLLCLLTFSAFGQAQPDCSAAGMNSLFVLTSDNNIFRIDNVNSVPSAPVWIDSIPAVAASGLSIGNNLNGGGNSPTFYTTIQDQYYYRDNAGWINTGHSTSTNAGNLGGGVRHIYNHRALSGSIYSYDGNGDGSILVFGTSSTSIYDVATDSVDNFYVLLTDINSLYKFDTTGNLVDTFQVIGMPQNLIQPGLTLLNNTFYALILYPTQNALLRGTVNGNVVTFTQIGILNLGSEGQDIAACPFRLAATGVADFGYGSGLDIFPNPTSDLLKIVTENGRLRREIQVMSDQGQVVYENLAFAGDVLDTKEFGNGMYLLRYSDGNRVVVKRFVVQHW